MLKPLLVADIKLFPIISCYPILWGIGSLVLGTCQSAGRFVITSSESAPWCITSSLKKEQPPEKGVLFGYPILLKKHDGIRVNVETIAGGWYNFIYDYLMLSHYIPLRQALKDRDFQLSAGSDLTQALPDEKSG